MRDTTLTRRFPRRIAATAFASALLAAIPLAANAAPPYDSDTTATSGPLQNSVLDAIDSGFYDYWTPDGYSNATNPPTTANDLHGTVKNADILAFNDQLAVWINNNATGAQQFKAIQDNEYNNGSAAHPAGDNYDQSFTVSQGLGGLLEQYYVKGLRDGSLPLTLALVNDSNGSAGAYIGSSGPKAAFSYPRPYLLTTPPPTAAQVPAGYDNTVTASWDTAACDPVGNASYPPGVNGSSLLAQRTGKSYADANGNLKIKPVAKRADTSREFSPNDVQLDVGYGGSGLCRGGSYPSGHTLNAYQSGITLSALIPELAPEVLVRASEGGNDRIVLGVHYPLDIMGSRSLAEAAIATRLSDAKWVNEVFLPAQTELRNYLEQQCGTSIPQCIAKEAHYADNPYDGKAIPGGTSQIVTDRKSSVSVYTERMTYGFPQDASKAGKAPVVPAGASNLLLTVFPTLTDAQRTSVLAQTEIASGYPLDQTGTANGASWERINLAAATSATVQVAADGSVKVLSTGGQATVTTPAPTGTGTGAGTGSNGGTQPHLPVVSG